MRPNQSRTSERTQRSTSISRRSCLIALALALVTVALVWLALQTSLSATLEERTLDWRFLVRGPQGPRAADIAVVLVEEEADLDYRSPIPRKHLAQVIEHLGEARLIGLDILLDKPSFDQEGDARLRQALAQNGRVIAVSYLEGGEEHLPLPYFGEVLLDRGYATFAAGKDVEIVRSGTAVRDLGGRRALSLAGCLYAHHLGLDTEALRLGTQRGLPEGSLLIDFSGPPNAVYRRVEGLAGGFAVCPSHLVAAGVYPPAFFRDRFVLVGSGLLDAPDRFRTPFFSSAYGFEKMFGVEVHAHFLQSLLRADYLRPWGSGRTLVLVFVLAMLVVFAVLSTDTLRSAGVLVLLLAGLWAAGFFLFVRQEAVLPLVGPSFGLLSIYSMAAAYQALTFGREKRQIRSMFEKYLSPEVIAQLLQDPSNWRLGGRSMDISVMFADLEGFTPLAEKLPPEHLVALINEFLTEMSRILWAQGGTIDKYEGDLIMAFFGAPVPQGDHAVRACRAALQMQARLAELRPQWTRQGYPELRVRIGLHSGRAVVGNMGSDFRFNYTAMGDTVNLAARLEPANKDFGTYTMISEATRQQAGEGEFQYRSLGEIQVKGKSEMVRVYELLPAQ